MKSNFNKKVAITFVLNGSIIGDDNLTLLRLQKALKTTFPATKITDLKLMSLVKDITSNMSNES
jgi:hypothetical protein